MVIYVGADHRGFKLKEDIKQFLSDSGYTVNDVGNSTYDENDDYVDFAKAVSEKVSADPTNSRGIVICGSGVGVDIVANRFSQIRSALLFSTEQAMASRSDDDANVISFAADFINPETAKKIVSVWMQTQFSNEERYKRRLEKIQDLDNSIH